MSRFVIVAIIAVLFVVGAPAAYYYSSKPADDQLDDTLRAMGFFPINPPSNLLSLGSLYYVDSRVNFFRTICPADQVKIANLSMSSPSTRTVADELTSGYFEAGSTLLGAGAISGSGEVKDSYLSKVQYSLFDVQLFEITLMSNRKIMRELMEDKDCQAVVSEVFRSGGYVCQGQTLLEGSGSFGLNSSQANGGKLETDIDKPALREAIKTAVRANSNVSLVEKSGKLITGAALKYGVSMGPYCLAPKGSRFQRVLPKNIAGRLWNYIKFNVVEPLLPQKT